MPSSRPRGNDHTVAASGKTTDVFRYCSVRPSIRVIPSRSNTDVDGAVVGLSKEVLAAGVPWMENEMELSGNFGGRFCEQPFNPVTVTL
ncbi:MAG: hypothetical protein R2788_12870 [Saprospiraceae bacterium]